MNWFRVHVGISSHPKTYALAAELKVKRQHAVGMMACIYEWAAQTDREHIELPMRQAASIWAEVAGWTKDPELFLASLIRTGWVDATGSGLAPTARLHDWADVNGSAIREAKSARERMKANRSSANGSSNGSPNGSPLRTNERTNNNPPNPPSRGARGFRGAGANGYVSGVPFIDRPHPRLITDVLCSRCELDHDARTDWPGLENPPCEPSCRECRRVWAKENVSLLTDSEIRFWELGRAKA